jgi:hypothetical protein
MAQAEKYAKETAQENYARNNGWSDSLKISITIDLFHLPTLMHNSFIH